MSENVKVLSHIVYLRNSIWYYLYLACLLIALAFSDVNLIIKKKKYGSNDFNRRKRMIDSNSPKIKTCEKLSSNSSFYG